MTNSKNTTSRLINTLLLVTVLAAQLSVSGEIQAMSEKEALEYAEREAIVKNLSNKLSTHWAAGKKDLMQLHQNASKALKRELFGMIWRMALQSNKAEVRQYAVNYLLEGYLSESAVLKGQAIRFLQDFAQQDFDSDAQEILKHQPLEDQYASDIIRIIGIAGIQTQNERLQQFANEDNDADTGGVNRHSYFASRHWAAKLALSRWGHDHYLNKVITKVKEENDIVLRSTTLFADLAYTKQPLAFDTLRYFLNSQQRLPPLKATVEGSLEALDAAVHFVNNIDNCPVTHTDITLDDLDKIKRWANQQSSWMIR